jgi:hypothetical protein
MSRVQDTNPFANYGHIVRGNQFIGRKSIIRSIQERLLLSHEPGNLALVGDHRVGKSSLAFITLIEPRRSLIETSNRLPIWINVSQFEQPQELFLALARSCFDEIDETDRLTEQIKDAYNRIGNNSRGWADTFDAIRRFFKRVRKVGVWPIFVLDEFDHARILFRDSVAAFQQLRSLSYDDPEGRVAFLTTSRRSIKEIELQSHSISTLDGIFATENVAHFDDQDFDEYFQQFSAAGLEINVEVRAQIESYCGRHPYLLGCLGYRIVSQYRETSSLNIDLAAQQVRPTFIGHFDRMVRLLSEEQKYDKLLQILFGPVINVSKDDVDDMVRYGVLQPTESGSYDAFSAHFRRYLQLISRKEDVPVDLWAIWRDTEIALRKAIKSKYEEKYGEAWIPALEKAQIKLKPIFDRCREAQSKELSSFGIQASSNLLDFTYPGDLFELIFIDWSLFSSIFGKDKNYWGQRKELLAKVRNPLAHNRPTVLQEHERITAEGYCREILVKIKAAGIIAGDSIIEQRT